MNRGIAVDIKSELSIHFTHRVVGDCSEMHDAIATIKIVRVDLTNILHQFSISCDQRLPVATLDKTNITANEGVTLLFQDINQMGPDKATMTSSKNLHS